MMIVELGKLKPNPFRDFTIDPIDQGVVKDLSHSIKEDGFWGGIVCRRIKDGTIQIAAGHHRVEAARKAGIRTADVFVGNGEIDDAAMVRIYARENATQRGNTGTSQTGSIASAIKFIARMVLGGVSEEFFRNNDAAKIQGNLTSEKGIGRDSIVEFLAGVPGINEGSVQQALANIKSSGDYARIIGNVQAELEQENKKALRALKRAEEESAKARAAAVKAEAERKLAAERAKAAREEAEKKAAKLASDRAEVEAKLAEKRRREAEVEMAKFDVLRETRDASAKATEAANRRVKTFDFEGVSKYLKNSLHIEVFRKFVTGQGVTPYLAVSQQSGLAKKIVEDAKKKGVELSGREIRENLTTQLLNLTTIRRRLDKEDEERMRAILKQEDWDRRMKVCQEDFIRGIKIAVRAMQNIEKLLKGWPKGRSSPISQEFREYAKEAQKLTTAITRLR